MGNEMGNNNVIGQQVWEESAKDFDKTMHPSDSSPGLNNINDEEKDNTKDVDMSEILKAPLISNGVYEKMDSDQIKISAVNEDLDEKNRGPFQDDTSTQDDYGNSNLPTKEGDETQEDNETETTTNSTEAVDPVSSAIEDMTSNKDTSSSDEQFKQLAHESEETTIENPPTLLEENFEGPPKDDEESCSQEVTAVVSNLVGEDTSENLEVQTRLSTIYDQTTPSSVQGETASSIESILIDSCVAEIKDAIVEDEPRERGNPSDVRLEDGTIQETSKNEEKQEICEMGKSKSCKIIAIDTAIESYEVLEEYKKVHGLENLEEEFPKFSAYGALGTDEAISQFQSTLAGPSATNGIEFMKHELSVDVVGEMSDSVSAAMEYNAIERTEKDHGGAVDEDVADKNEADNFEADKKSNGIHDTVSIDKVHGENFTGLCPLLSRPLPILNEEKIQEEVIIEDLAAPMTASSFALQRVEDSIKEVIRPANSAINEGTTTSTYEAKATHTQETTNNSQCDQSQQVLLEEPEVVKFENSETLTTCMRLSLATELIFPNVSIKEREGASAKTTSFTPELNEETVGFAAEAKQKKVVAIADKSSEEQCLLREQTLGRDAGEETPFLGSVESINSYSSEQHIKVVKDIRMTNISLMRAKDEGVEESEKNTLLSPRESSEGAFRASYQSARNNKPLHSLMTEDKIGMWSPLKEQEPVPKNSTTVSSPRSKEKHKPKSSLFAICMCCTTATN